jgi:hypothetical protein
MWKVLGLASNIAKKKEEEKGGGGGTKRIHTL